VEVEAALAGEAVVVVLAVSAIPVEVPVRFKAVNPAVVQVDLEGAAKVPLGVQVVGVLEAGNLAEEVLAVFAILAEVPVQPDLASLMVVLLELVKVRDALPGLTEQVLQEVVEWNNRVQELAKENVGVVTL
jgi:hypothetical protein